jgi:hypothetical protein
MHQQVSTTAKGYEADRQKPCITAGNGHASGGDVQRAR